MNCESLKLQSVVKLLELGGLRKRLNNHKATGEDPEAIAARIHNCYSDIDRLADRLEVHINQEQ